MQKAVENTYTNSNLCFKSLHKTGDAALCKRNIPCVLSHMINLPYLRWVRRSFLLYPVNTSQEFSENYLLCIQFVFERKAILYNTWHTRHHNIREGSISQYALRFRLVSSAFFLRSTEAGYDLPIIAVLATISWSSVWSGYRIRTWSSLKIKPLSLPLVQVSLPRSLV